MAGSEADRQPDDEAESSSRTERPSLADFLKPPPRSKSSMPPPPETASVADVPPVQSEPRNLGDLFSEAPVPRSRRRSSLLPHPPSPPSAAPVQPKEEQDEDHTDEDHSIDDHSDEDHSIDDHSIDAEVALSVPPPILSRRTAVRTAIAAGIVLAALGAWIGAQKLRSRSAAAPASAASAIASSVQPQPPLQPTADLDSEQPDDLLDELPIDEAKGLALQREARAMLEAGRIDEGVATARRAIEANPNDSTTYILLAAGLQDQGKWEEARQIFGKCVRQSTKAERSECVYFATRGK
jgi:hypothetical protein